MITLKYRNVDAFVERQQKVGNDVRWDGWDMVFFKPHRKAHRSPNGRYRNGQWGFEARVSPNQYGKWKVKEEYVSEDSARN